MSTEHLGEYFAADSGRSAGFRSSPGIFDPAITERPCRYPCDREDHVHAEDLPSNQGQQASLPHEAVR